MHDHIKLEIVVRKGEHRHGYPLGKVILLARLGAKFSTGSVEPNFLYFHNTLYLLET